MVSRKLRDNSGASLMLALLFFLLCAMAGSVVLAAGTAAAGRMKDAKAQEQAYFTVTSAAGLLRDEIDKKSLSCKYDSAAGSIVWIEEPEGSLSSLLEEYVGKIAKQVLAGATSVTPPVAKKLTVTPKGADNKEAMGTVEAEFSMKYTDAEYPDYTVVITLSLVTGEDEPGYYCTLTVPAAVVDGSAGAGTGGGGADKTLSLAWGNPVITRGG